MTSTKKILLLGVGNTAFALADFYLNSDEHGSQRLLFGTTRSADKTLTLLDRRIEPIHDDGSDTCLSAIEAAAEDACVLVSYPPDPGGVSDLRYAPLLQKAVKIVYISSTGVYEGLDGRIDEATALPASHSASGERRLAAESFWRERSACILRAPGLYGPQTGLHLRLLSGSYRLPGDGSNHVSRIHLDDLASIIDAAFGLAAQGSVYVVGDLKPATHFEVVSWLCQKLSLPLPPSQPLAAVSATLRGNRQIDSSRLRNDLQLELLYPTYVEGFTDCLSKCGCC
jgi:hypothetical protein